MRGFFNVKADFKTLPELLRENDYVTGVLNKPRDSSLTDDYDKYWDYHKILLNHEKRTASNYSRNADEFFQFATDAGKPFYLVVNIADPHKPFFADPKAEQPEFDKAPPSKVYSPGEVIIPGFLPNHPAIRKEMCNYYSSVKRGDDCVGAVLRSFHNSGLTNNTVIMFVSDHGMPLPYAKSSLYPDGVRTPWIVAWPGVAKPGSLDREHIISAVDFMPTILELAKVPAPDGLEGRSFATILSGKHSTDRDRVFTEFNESAGGVPFPMRAVHSKDHVYVFNAWGSGNHDFVCAANWYSAYNIIKKLASTDAAVKERFDHLNHRVVEELYDTRTDPHALTNRIADPAYAEVADSLRREMERWMRDTDDYLLPAFLARADEDELDRFMEQEDAAALKRASTLQWKRWKNRSGSTENRTALFEKQWGDAVGNHQPVGSSHTSPPAVGE
jgi:N-sulfoglucosamine sulfohydrolase